MEIPFLEIPETQSPDSGDKSHAENNNGADLFDISYLLDLTETANKQSHDEKYIIFKLNEDVFGAPLNNVVEVCRSLPVTSLPNSPRWLAGIANLRGNLLSVMDLQAFEDSDIPSAKSKIIVLTDRYKQTSIGLLVDQVIEIAFLPKENIFSFPAPKKMGARYFVSEKTTYKESALLVLDTQKLFSSPEINKFQEH
jgi:purine-binding chemotaxis protein CheW